MKRFKDECFNPEYDEAVERAQARQEYNNSPEGIDARLEAEADLEYLDSLGTDNNYADRDAVEAKELNINVIYVVWTFNPETDTDEEKIFTDREKANEYASYQRDWGNGVEISVQRELTAEEAEDAFFEAMDEEELRFYLTDLIGTESEHRNKGIAVYNRKYYYR